MARIDEVERVNRILEQNPAELSAVIAATPEF